MLFVIPIDIVIMTSGLTPVLLRRLKRSAERLKLQIDVIECARYFNVIDWLKSFLIWLLAGAITTKGAHSGVHGQHQTGNHLVPFGQNESRCNAHTNTTDAVRQRHTSCMSSLLAVGCARIRLQWGRVHTPQGGGTTRPAKPQRLLLHPSARFHRIINILVAHMLWQAPSGQSSSTWHITCMLHPTAARCCTHTHQTKREVRARVCSKWCTQIDNQPQVKVSLSGPSTNKKVFDSSHALP